MRKKFTLLVLIVQFGIISIVNAQNFIHPGILHKESDFERMRQKVTERAEPWYTAYQNLLKSSEAQLSWNPRATETVIRGGTGDNVAVLYKDVAAAYQSALIYKINGNTRHGDKAVRILNAWSSTHTVLSGNADRYLASGLFGYQFANVAEMMRDYPGFELEPFKEYMMNVFYKPLVERFLLGNEYGSEHNDACITNYRANWDLCNMAAMLAIGILCDDEEIYNKGIEYFKSGGGNGCIERTVNHIHSGTLGQWEESGRDQGHTHGGMTLMGLFMEMAYNQGDDLFSYSDSRYRKGAEYIARYNIMENGEGKYDDLPFTSHSWRQGQTCAWKTESVISNAGRGDYCYAWGLLYNHYALRVNQENLIPNIKEIHQLQPSVYGPGGHAGSYDFPGFFDLTFLTKSDNEIDSNLLSDLPDNPISDPRLYVNKATTFTSGSSYFIYNEARGQYLIQGSDYGTRAALTTNNPKSFILENTVDYFTLKINNNVANSVNNIHGLFVDDGLKVWTDATAGYGNSGANRWTLKPVEGTDRFQILSYYLTNIKSPAVTEKCFAPENASSVNVMCIDMNNITDASNEWSFYPADIITLYGWLIEARLSLAADMDNNLLAAYEEGVQAFEDKDQNTIQAAINSLRSAMGIYILNARFDIGSTDDWDFNGSAYKSDAVVGSGCTEIYRKIRKFSQIITDLPAGKYKLSAQAFYRNDGGEQAYLFAGTTEQKLPERTGTENSMAEASASFTEGLYPVSLVFENPVQQDVTIGINCKDAKTWTIFDDFKLELITETEQTNTRLYSPMSPTGIEDVEDSVIAVEYYSLQGIKIPNPAHPGIYIIKKTYESQKVEVTKVFINK